MARGVRRRSYYSLVPRAARLTLLGMLFILTLLAVTWAASYTRNDWRLSAAAISQDDRAFSWWLSQWYSVRPDGGENMPMLSGLHHRIPWTRGSRLFCGVADGSLHLASVHPLHASADARPGWRRTYFKVVIDECSQWNDAERAARATTRRRPGQRELSVSPEAVSSWETLNFRCTSVRIPLAYFTVGCALVMAYCLWKAVVRPSLRMRRGACVMCAYDLRGSAGHVCSECGSPFR